MILGEQFALAGLAIVLFIYGMFYALVPYMIYLSKPTFLKREIPRHKRLIRKLKENLSKLSMLSKRTSENKKDTNKKNFKYKNSSEKIDNIEDNIEKNIEDNIKNNSFNYQNGSNDKESQNKNRDDRDIFSS